MPATSRSIPLPYAESFDPAAPGLPGATLPWLAELRSQSAERLARAGLPSTRVERWKYTNLNGLAAVRFASPGAAAAVAENALQSTPLIENAYRLVFIDGQLRRDLSSEEAPPRGLRLLGLAEALNRDPNLVSAYLSEANSSDDAITLVNLAFMTDGFVALVEVDAIIDTPIELSFIGSSHDQPLAMHGRNLVIMGAGSRATLIETYGGRGVYWSNPVSQIRLAENAELRHYKAQMDSAAAFHIASTSVHSAAGSRYESFVLAAGAALARNEIRVALDGEGAACRLGGSYLARGRQHVDNTTEIIHAKPHTTSDEVYKGVLDDQSRGVFQGRIVVQPHAQKSDGHQLNKTILLSDRAEIDTKPELEIYADDVKCSHGATAGELDDGALFFLRARGIDVAEARRMLVTAFVGDAVDGISAEAVQHAFGNLVERWMTGDRMELS
jgi:Fe-S cluster assembly protein SufD